MRYCARPPLSQERFGRLNDETLVYSLRKPTHDGRTELILTPVYGSAGSSRITSTLMLDVHGSCARMILWVIWAEYTSFQK